MLAVTAKPRGGKRSSRWRGLGLGLLFISPVIVGILAFNLYPILMSLYYSFTNFSMLKAPEWVGLSNYVEMFRDPLYWKSVSNTLFLTVVGVPLLTVSSLLLAVLLNQRLPGSQIFRTLIYMPSVVPTVAVALLWVWILNPNSGLLNLGLKSLGLPAPGWFADPKWAKSGILLLLLWGVGGSMVIFLAALQDISQDIREAASLDGANAVQSFWFITIPSIKNVIIYSVVTTSVSLLQFFAQAYVISGGGGVATLGTPNNSTLFYGLYLYQTGFGFLKMGVASAMAWVLLIVSLLATWLLFKFSNLFDR